MLRFRGRRIYTNPKSLKIKHGLNRTKFHVHIIRSWNKEIYIALEISSFRFIDFSNKIILLRPEDADRLAQYLDETANLIQI